MGDFSCAARDHGARADERAHVAKLRDRELRVAYAPSTQDTGHPALDEGKSSRAGARTEVVCVSYVVQTIRPFFCLFLGAYSCLFLWFC